MLCQDQRVTFTGHNRPDDQLAGHAHNVAEDALELEVHLLQGFLHVQNMRRTMLDQFATIAHQRAQDRNLVIGAKRRVQQAERVQLLQPLGIIPITFASRNRFDMPSVDEIGGDPMLFQ